MPAANAQMFRCEGRRELQLRADLASFPKRFVFDGSLTYRHRSIFQALVESQTSNVSAFHEEAGRIEDNEGHDIEAHIRFERRLQSDRLVH